MIFWGAMAFQAPTHAVWFGVVNYFHVIHMTVACHATDASVHVNCMVEVNIIRGLVNPNPRNGISGFPRIPNRGEFRALRFNLRVTVHTGLGSWNI
jgi:hypothetical protein